VATTDRPDLKSLLADKEALGRILDAQDTCRDRKRKGVKMIDDQKPDISKLMADKEALRKILEEQDKLTGFVPDPTATPERLQERMLADGVRPEDNIGSREIIRMREEE
jgi:hypothetical protein